MFNKTIQKIKKDIKYHEKSLAKVKEEIANLLGKAAVSEQTLATQYEAVAKDKIEVKTCHQNQLQQLNAQLEHIQTVMSNSDSGLQLQPEDIFISTEITHAIIRLFVDSIIVDDANDDIQINFKHE